MSEREPGPTERSVSLPRRFSPSTFRRDSSSPFLSSCPLALFQIDVINELQLLTAKPVIYLVNLSERDYVRKKNKWCVRLLSFRLRFPRASFSLTWLLLLSLRLRSHPGSPRSRLGSMRTTLEISSFPSRSLSRSDWSLCPSRSRETSSSSSVWPRLPLWELPLDLERCEYTVQVRFGSTWKGGRGRSRVEKSTRRKLTSFLLLPSSLFSTTAGYAALNLIRYFT